MKIVHYLAKVFTLPPHIVIIKAARKFSQLWKHKQKWKDAILPTYETHYSFERIHSVGKKVLRSFIRPLPVPSLPKEAILSACLRIFNHQFDLLGSGWVKVFRGMSCMGLEGIRYACRSNGQVNEQNLRESDRIKELISPAYSSIDWQIDFKSGYRWSERTWSRDIQYGGDKGADVKVPWELARMQHLPMLAWGYALDPSAKYILEFQDQLLDFISANPPRYGVNWVCTMDVGIRIANWLFAYDVFRSYGAQFDPSFEKIFARSVFEHGKHIIEHLEWDPYLRSNHYLANIAGLLFVAAYLGHEKWLAFAVQELQAEVFAQFHPDGSNFEASTSYHRLSAEMVLYATALAQELGIGFAQNYLDRIQKMADFTRDITKPDGTIVQFGDNDSGRFIKAFPDIDERDHRYLVKAIRSMKDLTSVLQAQLDPRFGWQKGLALNSNQVKMARGSSSGDETNAGRISLMPKTDSAICLNIEPQEECARDFCAYEDFGLFIQRKGPWMLVIRCGCMGQKGNAGHAHNDQLSFELALNGLSMIIDPGTYLYTPLPEMRRHFRSTAMHNTLSIPGKEQAQDKGLFQMKDRAHAKVLRWDEREFRGMHQGFDVAHQRTLRLYEDCLEGIDECGATSAASQQMDAPKNETTKEIVFHFAPGWRGNLIDERSVEWSCGDSKIAISSDEGAFHIIRSEYSKGYGQKGSNLKLVLQTDVPRTRWKIFLKA